MGANDDGDNSFTFDQAIENKDLAKQLEVMKSVMDSMHANQLWTLVNLPEGMFPIEYKTFRNKEIGSNGKVETYKATLMVKGYSQKKEINFEKIFTLVAMLKSIWNLLVIATHLDYEIWHVDGKIAFLN